MNAPDTLTRLRNPERSAEMPASGLHAPIIMDRVTHSVRLLIGLVAGFGACTPVETVRGTLAGLGRADAHLVLAELSEKHDRVRSDVELLYPELLEVLKKKCE